jgi:hypothetical protein
MEEQWKLYTFRRRIVAPISEGDGCISKRTTDWRRGLGLAEWTAIRANGVRRLPVRAGSVNHAS